MSEIKNSGLDQYDAEPFKQQQLGTSGVEGVKTDFSHHSTSSLLVIIIIIIIIIICIILSTSWSLAVCCFSPFSVGLIDAPFSQTVCTSNENKNTYTVNVNKAIISCDL